MKLKLLLLICLCYSAIAISQNTYVPDDNFEQNLIDKGYDNVLDNYVLTANINTLNQFTANNDGIQELTGIEDFTALTHLDVSSNYLTSLDLSQNINLTNLSCSQNSINGTLDLSQNTALVAFICNDNFIDNLILPQTPTLIDIWFFNNEITTIDVTQNPNLIFLLGDDNLIDGTVDLSQNTSLYRVRLESNSIDQLLLPQTTTLNELWCRNNELTALNVDYNTSLNRLMCSSNQLTTINLALNTALETLFIHHNMINSLDLSLNSALSFITANNNNLNYLSVKNGNNTNLTGEPYFLNNPALTCIEVDDATFSSNNWTNYTDSQSYFSEDCNNLGVDEFEAQTIKVFPNPVVDVLYFKLQNTIEYNILNIKGTVLLKGHLSAQKNSIDLSQLGSGLYFLKTKTATSSSTQKIIKA